MEIPRIVSQDEWLTARKALLVKEKEHMRAGDRLSTERRALPWVKVEKDYVFDAPEGKVSLADLFDGCSQLIVHHLMFHPDWEAGCDGCSFQADHIDGPGQHLEHHDVKIVAVSRAPLAKLAAYKRRMGWRFDWVSSYGSDFNYDFHVSFTQDQIAEGRVDYNFGTITDDARYHSEELPGVSVFYKDQDGQVFHTYSTYARGLDAILGGDHYLDLTPKGRCEADYPNWPRRHDEYERAAPRSGEPYAERRA
jgi:predicted dithiol-disulfide oxidoreductase (DUF899 family)